MLAEFINFFSCWRWWSNALKQDNQATPPQSSLTWIPYFLLALPAINISIMEWRNVLAFTEYLLCQGQGVFPLHPTRATKQRFTKVLQHESLISDLQRIEFAVFCDVLVQFAHACWVYFHLFLSGWRNELKQVNQATIFHASSTWSLHSNLLHLEEIVLFRWKQRL